MTVKLTALALFALLLFSVIPSAFALSPIDFTSTETVTSQKQQFEQVYEHQNSVYFLDTNLTDTFFFSNYDVNTQTITHQNTGVSDGVNTVDADAYQSPVDDTNYAIELDGSIDYLTAANSGVYDVTTEDFWAFTLLYRDSDTGGTETIFKKFLSGAGNQPGYLLDINNDQLRAGYSDGTNVVVTLSSVALISVNTWYAVAVNFDRDNNMTIYLNKLATQSFETRSTSIAGQSGNASNAQTFHVGRNSNAADRFCDCRFDMFIPPQTGTLSESDFVALSNGNWSAISHDNLYHFNFQDATDSIGTNDLTMNGSPTFTADVADISTDSITTYAVGRDFAAATNVYANIHLEDMSVVNSHSQASDFFPHSVAQTTDTIYTALYDDHEIFLGSIGRDFTGYDESVLLHNATSSGVPANGEVASQTGSGNTVLLHSGADTIAAEKFTAAAQVNNVNFDEICLTLSKSGSPTGSATVGVFDGSGNVVSTFASLDVSTLDTGKEELCFHGNPHTMGTDDYVGIEYTGGDISNRVDVWRSSAADYDGSNAVNSAWDGAAWNDLSGDLAFKLLTAVNTKMAAYEGTPDTVYTFFESGTSSVRAVKYDGTATLLGTAMTHNIGNPFSVIQLANNKMIVQTTDAIYEIDDTTITEILSNNVKTRYPQSFSISPSTQDFSTTDIYLANATVAYLFDPATGSQTQTQVLVDTTTAPTLGTYDPDKYYYLQENQLTVEAASGGTTWTIKEVGTRNDYTITGYIEQVGISLVSNSTLFDEGVLKVNCDSGVYTMHIPYFAVGDDSDCDKYRVTATSDATVGREVYGPFERTADLVHADAFTSYTFTINAGTPTNYMIKSLYDGVVVDVANFDSGFTASQRYLFGQCYQVEVLNVNTGMSALIGSICANEITQKNINIDSVEVPPNWQGRAWSWNLERDFSNSTNNSIIFTVEKDETPFDANIRIENSLYQNGTVSQWFNFTGQTAPIILSENGYLSNSTLYISVYDNSSDIVVRAVSAGKLFQLDDWSAPFGPVFGISMMGVMVVAVAGMFPRSMGTIAIIAVLATAGIMWSIGWLDDMPVAIWPGLIGLAVIGIFADRRR